MGSIPIMFLYKYSISGVSEMSIVSSETIGQVLCDFNLVVDSSNVLCKKQVRPELAWQFCLVKIPLIKYKIKHCILKWKPIPQGDILTKSRGFYQIL